MSAKLFVVQSLAVIMTLAALPLSISPTAAQVIAGEFTQLIFVR